MRRRPGPADLVAEVAARHGMRVNPHVASLIARALLDWADAAYEVHQTVPKEAWAQTGFRDSLRQEMRRQLLDEVTSQGRIPTALPSEAVRYLDNPFPKPSGSEVPPWAVQAGAPYGWVEVTLAVQVRTPPVDRAAAVRAGLL
jgi:hypothetical protein